MMLRRPAERRSLATVLFTDIVASTETTARVGDRHWKELLRRHHAAIRAALRTHHGREVDTAGDGFFAVFQQPGDAIRCALEARAAVAGIGLQIRAGVHTGEVEQMGPKVGGLAVVIGARVLASCEPGQIRVTSTVRDLVTGAGIDLKDVGTHQLKGVPGEWHLFALAVDAPPAAAIGEPAPERAATRPRLLWLAAAGLGLATAIAVGLAVTLSQPPNPVVRAAANMVVRIDPAAQAMTEAHQVAPGPALLATDGSALWIASETARTLTRLEIASGALTPTGLDGVPTGLAIADGTVYVAQAFDHSVERLDAETATASAPIEQISVHDITFDGDEGWGIDPVNNVVVHLAPGRDPEMIELPDGSGPADIVAGADAVWIANAVGRSVTRIDSATGEQATFNVVDPPTLVSTSTAAIWVASETRDSLVRIDPRTNRVVATLEVCDAPVSLATSGDEVWIACAGSRQLMHVGADGSEMGTRLELPATPGALLVVQGDLWMALRAN